MTTKNVFSTLQFHGTWRSYQQKILDELKNHITDDKLHIVAAPGAGKTILGLEVIRRLGKPCLILAPTITIKNQWALRLKQSFMTDMSLAEDMISSNILHPKIITVATYQGLLAGLSGRQESTHEKQTDDTDLDDDQVDEEISEKPVNRFNPTKAKALIQILKKAHVRVLCFDEAHHLRKEWWKALDYLKNELLPDTTLSLTATPPYDVEVGEWQRYENLCGPVDAEICIPELVKNGDLCPHQDLLYFAPLRDAELVSYEAYQKQAQNFITDFLSDKQFAEELYQLEIWTKPNDYMELYFEDPDFYIACASFFKFHNMDVSPAFLKLFDIKQKDIPDLTSHQINLLLTGFLYKYRENYPTLEPYLKKLQTAALKAGLIHRQNITIDDDPRIAKVMAHSLGKLDAIDAIVKTEVQNLKQNLRMVILAGYIRYDYINSTKESLGVIPIFKRLDKLHLKYASLAVLTGKIILIPKDVKPQLIELIHKAKLSPDSVHIVPFKHNTDYVEVKATEKAKSKIVFLITELFNQGDLTIMVGTQSLLGEGWDAPCINSLILSNIVASYMLSNQMRGRAIRIDKKNPKKVSHIWHLANVKATNPYSALQTPFQQLNGDLAQLTRRFSGYEAPSLKPPYTIQNGINRCYFNLKHTPSTQSEFDTITEKSLNYSRVVTPLAWQEGLISDKSAAAVPHLKHELLTKGKKSTRFCDGWAIRLSIATSIAFEFSFSCLRLQQYLLAMLVWLVWIGFMAPSTWRILRTGRPQGYLKQIVMVIWESLFHADLVHTRPHIHSINIKNTQNTNYAISIDNTDNRDSNILMNAIQEFLNPIDNPRYLLVRKNTLAFLFKQIDYHAIPTLLATNKKLVIYFKQRWAKRIGSCNIIYMRTTSGHKLLLKARMNAYSHLNQITQKTSRWG